MHTRFMCFHSTLSPNSRVKLRTIHYNQQVTIVFYSKFITQQELTQQSLKKYNFTSMSFTKPNFTKMKSSKKPVERNFKQL